MEVKDTVTKTNIYNCHNTLEERLLEQAEISFRAGVNEVLRHIGNTRHLSGVALEGAWQAKLKEWGVGKGISRNPNTKGYHDVKEFYEE